MKHLESLYIILIAAAAAMTQGCDKTSMPGQGSWKPAAAAPKEILVSANGTDVEKYEFVYDASGCLDSLRRLDLLDGKKLLDVCYTYGEGQTLIKGVFSPDGISQSISVTSNKGGVSYSGTAWKSWVYNLALSGNLPVSLSSKNHFDANSGFVSTDTNYEESYTSREGDIVEVTAGTVVKGDTKRASKTYTENAVTWQYTYISGEDRQNFNSILMECPFPVWYAMGLPGCRHLISDIVTLGGSLDYQTSQHIDYAYDQDGNILKATRTYISAGQNYLTLEYTFVY